jgi:hypothetical protein
MNEKRISVVIDFYKDWAVATVRGADLWKEKFSSVTDNQRYEMVTKLREDAHRQLADVFHLLAFGADPDVMEPKG